MFNQDFTCPDLLKDIETFYLYGTITLYGSAFILILVIISMPLDWSPFARHY